MVLWHVLVEFKDKKQQFVLILKKNFFSVSNKLECFSIFARVVTFLCLPLMVGSYHNPIITDTRGLYYKKYYGSEMYGFRSKLVRL